MCGIVALWNREVEDYQVALRDWWEKMAHRGEDSYGVLVMGEDKEGEKGIKGIKSLDMDSVIEKLANFKKIYWVLGHNRKASIGGVKTELAHPIFKEGWAVIHNGTYRTLFSVYEEEADSDTMAICHLLADFERGDINPKFLRRLLKEIGVVFSIKREEDKFKLFFHRDISRPLYISFDLEVLASEPLEKGYWQEVKSTDFKFTLFSYEENPFLTLPIESKKFYPKLATCETCMRVFWQSGKEKECPSCRKFSYSGYSNYYKKL